ncbi:hypothetical protein ACSFBI_06435 [Variovorax sp. RB3P1]|jgi:hypothetical protein|uniref:hypothetical protein n=1 Tax=Variovorax sp. RB3P1 TaxID=3443732 RepID=UPI003F47ABCC
MAIALPLLLLFALMVTVLLGGYLLRVLLPRHHALQSRLTDEAISSYTDLLAKNFKGILGALLVIYFLVVGFLYG